MTLEQDADFSELDLFCKQRLDLELQTMPESEYYAGLQRDYEPIRWLAWLVVLLVAGAGVFAGISARLGRSLKWDDKNEQIVGDDLANSFLARPYRKGFEINK
eukprot:COSAG02_NODE_21644_length_780_cov_1.123348_1_plen_103_part_00